MVHSGSYAARPKVNRFHLKKTAAGRVIRKSTLIRKGKNNQRKLKKFRPQVKLKKRS